MRYITMSAIQTPQQLSLIPWDDESTDTRSKARVKFVLSELIPAGAQLSAVGMTFAGDTAAEQVEKFLRDGAGRVNMASRWWIGDCLNWLYPNDKSHGRFTPWVGATGLDEKTLYNLKWVCSRIEISRRREGLTYSHHAEVAPLEPEEQEYWLARADEERWSAKALRAKLRKGDQATEHPAEPSHESLPEERILTVLWRSRADVPRIGVDGGTCVFEVNPVVFSDGRHLFRSYADGFLLGEHATVEEGRAFVEAEIAHRWEVA
jgi:hypothetical protein